MNVMTHRLLFTLLTLAFCIGEISFSLPRDLSIGAFEQFKNTVEKEVEQQLTKEFKDKEENLNKLSMPFEIGKEVSVSIIQGDRKRTVQGKFKGIKGQSAEIGDRLILLSDLEEMDRDRLFFGNQEQLLQLKINQLRKDMEKDKSRRREILINQKYKEAGYTKKFFKNAIRLGERYWPMSELGDKKVFLLAEIPQTGEFIKYKLANRSGLDGNLLVFMDKKPIASLDALSSSGQVSQKEDSSKSFEFLGLKSDLVDLTANALKSKLKIWFIRPELGCWFLRAATVNPTENPEVVLKAGFTFQVVKSSVKEFDQLLRPEVLEAVESAKKYQSSIADQIAEMRRLEQEKKEQEEKERLAREAERKRLAEEARRKEKEIKEIDKNYDWLKADVESNEKTSSRKKIITNNNFDDVYFPSTIDEMGIEIYTDWTKIYTKSREFYGLKYRFIKVQAKDSSIKYLIHYQASCVNGNPLVSDFICLVTVQAGEERVESWQETFRLPPSWAGELHGIKELPFELMKQKITAVSIEKYVDQ